MKKKTISYRDGETQYLNECAFPSSLSNRRGIVFDLNIDRTVKCLTAINRVKRLPQAYNSINIFFQSIAFY